MLQTARFTGVPLFSRISSCLVQNWNNNATDSKIRHKVVDTWAQPMDVAFIKHVPELIRLLKQSGSPLFKHTDSKDPRSLDDIDFGKDYLGACMEGHVDKVMLNAWQRPGQVVISNEEIMEYKETYPDQVVGIGTCNLEKPQDAVREVERCVKDYGFKGIRILPWLWNRGPTDRYYYPILSKCVELGIPFCTQAGHTGPLCPSEFGRPVPYIDQIALDFPDLKIVCGHIGYPWTDEMIGTAWKHENVFIDTSAYDPRYYPKQLIHYMNTYGKEKVMFGTNWPQLQFDKCVKYANQLKLDNDAMENFLWKNANRVFELDMEK